MANPVGEIEEWTKAILERTVALDLASDGACALAPHHDGATDQVLRATSSSLLGRGLLVLGLGLTCAGPGPELPAIQGSPIAAARRAPLQVLQRENRLPDLAPERRLIAAKPFENSVIEVGQTKKATRKLGSIRIAPGLEDFDNVAHFSGTRRIGC